LVNKTQNPDPEQDPDSREMVDPDPDPMNSDPQHWFLGEVVAHYFALGRQSTDSGQLSGESVPVSKIHINADLNQRNIPPGGFRTARRAYTLATPTIPTSLCLTPDKSIILALSLRLRIHMFLGLLDPDPDPLLRGMDSHPSIILKTLIPSVL
jgi:hypothetical protein